MWEATHPHRKWTEARPILHEEAGNRLTEKLTRQDATDPKHKAVTDYKDHPPPQSPEKLKTGEPIQHNGHNNLELNK